MKQRSTGRSITSQASLQVPQTLSPVRLRRQLQKNIPQVAKTVPNTIQATPQKSPKSSLRRSSLTKSTNPNSSSGFSIKKSMLRAKSLLVLSRPSHLSKIVKDYRSKRRAQSVIVRRTPKRRRDKILDPYLLHSDPLFQTLNQSQMRKTHRQLVNLNTYQIYGMPESQNQESTIQLLDQKSHQKQLVIKPLKKLPPLPERETKVSQKPQPKTRLIPSHYKG